MIVADIISDDEECLIEIREGKERYVENIQPSIPVIIKNGKWINREQFTMNKRPVFHEGK